MTFQNYFFKKKLSIFGMDTGLYILNNFNLLLLIGIDSILSKINHQE